MWLSANRKLRSQPMCCAGPMGSLHAASGGKTRPGHRRWDIRATARMSGVRACFLSQSVTNWRNKNVAPFSGSDTLFYL